MSVFNRYKNQQLAKKLFLLSTIETKNDKEDTILIRSNLINE